MSIRRYCEQKLKNQRHERKRAMSGELEPEQFILRLPTDQADRVREAIRTDALGNRLQVEFLRDKRHAHVKWDGEVLSAKLVDLPCLTESYKTLDKKTVYKTGDISQMLVCSPQHLELPTENVEELPLSRRKEVVKKFNWNHGITPPLKNTRKRRFRKTTTKKFVDSPEVEKEVRRLLREDCNAVRVSFKVIMDEEKQNDDTQSVLSEADASRSHTPGPLHDEDSFLSSQSEDRSALLQMLEEASCSSSEEGSEEEEIAVDDSIPESIESEEVEALRLMIQDLDMQIEGQKLKIQNTANTLLRERFESFLLELEKQRMTKTEELRRLLS